MSYSFYLDVESISSSKILGETGFTDIKFVDIYPVPQNDKWPQGFTYIYRDGISSRALEVEYNSSTIRIRIFTASSPEDYQLALKLTTAISKVYNVLIIPEDNDAMSLEAFQNHYDTKWLTQHCQGGLSMLLDMSIKNNSSPIKISGVTKTMEIGDRVLEQLIQYKPNVFQEFFSRLKRLNYIDNEDVFQSNIFVISDDVHNKNIRLSTYTEGVETLIFDKNTFVALVSDRLKSELEGKEKLYLPLVELQKIIGEKAIWLSEEQLLLPKLESEAWESLLKQVRLVAIKNTNDIFKNGYDAESDPFKDKNENNQSVDFVKYIEAKGINKNKSTKIKKNLFLIIFWGSIITLLYFFFK